MLAGLLFATHDAADRPDLLTATLPFGGGTLVEAQARALIEAGASQIIVIVSRLTPELLGAVSRIQRRGVAVDPVRTAGEAAEKLHPLARVLVLADGLVTTAELLAPLAREGGDALLVVEEEDAPSTFERLGGRMAWAGVARVPPARLAELARLPRDYDLQSALLRATAQAGAATLLLPRGAIAAGHGIENRAGAVAARGRALLAGVTGQRVAWFDRWLVGPIGRVALPALVEHGVPESAMAGVAAVAGVGGLALLWAGHPVPGLALLLIAAVPLALGGVLSRLRDETGFARAQDAAAAVLAAAGAVLLGRWVDLMHGGTTGRAVAVALVLAGALAERATLPATRRRWWATPPAYILPALLLTAAGWPLAALVAAGLYASATLSAAIEALRRQA